MELRFLPPGLLKVVGANGAFGPLKMTACGLSAARPAETMPKILDDPGLRVAQPGEPWNVLPVDGQRDELLARLQAVLEHRQKAPRLPAEERRPPILLIDSSVGQPQPRGIAVALDRVRAYPALWKSASKLAPNLMNSSTLARACKLSRLWWALSRNSER